MSNASFSSAFTEKQHASTAIIKKFRPDLGQNLLTCRAWGHTARPTKKKNNPALHPNSSFNLVLVGCTSFQQQRQGLQTYLASRFRFGIETGQLLPDVSPTVTEKALKKTRETLQNLRSKNPNHISGRHVFYSDVVMKGKLEEQKVGRKVNFRSIMRLHASEWSALPDSKKDIYNCRALVLQDERRQAHQSQASILSIVAGKLSEDISETARSSNPSMSISASRLTPADLHRWESMLDSDTYSSSKCKKLRQVAIQTPAETIQSSPNRTESRGHSDLYMRVARAREHFATAIFVLSPDAETPLFFRFVYASLKPVQTHFLQLSELSLPPSSDESLRTSPPQWDEIFFAWTYEWHDIVKPVKVLT
eukprot:4462782-Amphidinium_carterae.1